MSPSCNFTVFYVDDSGSEATGYTTFSWVQVNPANWADAMQQWLAFRADTFRRYGIPASTRLHATDLAGGRGNPSHDPASNGSAQGLELIRDGLDAIAALPGIALGTVYRQTTARGRDFENDKENLYRGMVAMLDRNLGAHGRFGMIVMDGDGSNAIYARGHRALDGQGRRLIEDPFFRQANSSQWVQIADFAAWTAYRSLRPSGRRNKTSSWYDRLLGHLDVNGGPLAL